jgi:transposase
MSFSFIRGDDPDQAFLLPPDAREWLPPGHLAWQLLSVVGEVDLDPFLAGYRADGRSRPAYHPGSMLALVMYCYCKGTRSSRAIEAASFDDLGARVIIGNTHPDHATIARFVTRHERAIKGLLVQTLVIAARDGLLRVDVVAGDGTVVKANASAAGNVTAEQLDIDIAQLQEVIDAEVQAWFAQAAAEDAAEDALFGHPGDVDDDDGPAPDQGPGGPGSLTHTVGKLLRRRAAKARLEQREAQRDAEITADRQARVDNWAGRVAAREQAVDAARDAYQAKTEDWQSRADAAAATGKKLGGPRPVPVDDYVWVRRAREALAKVKGRLADAEQAAAAPIPDPAKPLVVNSTDPASRTVPGKNGGGFLQGYNLQAVATKKQLILSIGTHDSPNDTAALHPNLRAARANLDAAGITDPIGVALFDAGYASDTNFTTPCPDPDTTLLVAVNKETRQTGRDPDHPARAKGMSIESWQQMTARLDTDDGKTVYRQRAAIIEPVFAQLINRLSRHLNYRGDHVDTELHLWGTTHNIGKIIKNRVNRVTAIPSTA